MSKRITVNLPDDVAEHLETIPEGGVSSYVTSVLRDRIDHEQRTAATHRMLADAGYSFTPEGLDRMRDRLARHNSTRASRPARSTQHAA
jgi:hypothetical protein